MAGMPYLVLFTLIVTGSRMATHHKLDDEPSDVEVLREEALLYVDQALVLEETNHIREVHLLTKKTAI